MERKGNPMTLAKRRKYYDAGYLKSYKPTLAEIAFNQHWVGTNGDWITKSEQTKSHWKLIANAVAREVRKRDKEKYSTERLSRLLMKGKKK